MTEREKRAPGHEPRTMNHAFLVCGISSTVLGDEERTLLAALRPGGIVLFLHRVVAGPADRSYGIHVARLAGVPAEICLRAEAVLRLLERQELKVMEATTPPGKPRQLSLFPAPEEAVAERLRRLDLERLTPLEALNLLADLKRGLDG